MRVTIWLLCTAVAGSFPLAEASAQEAIRWQPTLDIAKRIAGQTDRLVLVHFWSPSCEPCRIMEREVFPRMDVAAAINADYVPVKLNADHFPATAQQYGVSALPTDIVLTPQGQLIDKHVGLVAADKYLALLHRRAAAAGHEPRPTRPLFAGAPPEQPRSGPARSAPPPPNRYVGYPNMERGGSSPGDTASRHPVPRYSGQPSLANPPLTNQPTVTPNPHTLPTDHRVEDYQAGNTQNSGSTPPPHRGPSGYVRSSPEAPAEQAGYPSRPPDAGRFGQQPSPQVAAGNPPLGLDGYCPVQLTEKERWVKGNSRWGLIHRERTYLFAGPEEQRQFYTDPDRYAPAYSGGDIVAAVEHGREVAGRREHGAWFDGRVYLFSSEDSYSRFNADPYRYVQAMQQIMAASGNTAERPAAGPGLR